MAAVSRAALLFIAGVVLPSATAFLFTEIAFVDVEQETEHEIVVGAFLDSSTLVWQGYADYFQWLNENGGVVVDGRPASVRLVVADPLSDSFGAFLRGFRTFTDGVEVAPVLAMLGSGNPVWDQNVMWAWNNMRVPFIVPLLAPTATVQTFGNVFGVGTPVERVLAGAMHLLEEQGAQAVHTISEDSAWAQEACGAAGSFGIPLGQSITVPVGASKDNFTEALLNLSMRAVNESQENVIAACVSSRETCHELLESMARLDHNVHAVVVTNCIEEDIQYSVNWDVPLYSWVLGADSWTPNIGASRNKTSLWDAESFLDKYIKTHKSSLVQKEYAAALNAAWLLMRAAEATNSTNSTAWIQWLSGANEETDHGTFSFDANGQNQIGAITKQFVRPKQYAELVGGAEASAWNVTYPKPRWGMVACIGDIAEQRGLLQGLTGAETCEECPKTMTVVYNEELDLRYCSLCEMGSYPYWDDELVHCVKCSPGSYNDATDPTKCTGCAPGKFQDEQEQTSCKHCPTGLVAPTFGLSECVSCPAGSYSSGEDRSACDLCPSGALCVDGTITNQGTYFLLDDAGEITASDFAKCLHGDGLGLRGGACLENQTCWRDDNGRETMKGLLCGTCKDGFGKEGTTGLCKKCGSFLENLFSASLEPLSFLLLANAMVLIVVYTDYSKPKNSCSIIAKQAMSYVQMLSVMLPYLTLEDNLAPLRHLRNIQQYVGFSAPDIALSGAHCLASDFFPGWKPFNLVIIIGYFYFPVLLMLAYYVFLAARCLGRPIGGQSSSILSNRTFINVVVVYTFFAHNKTAKLFITALSCRLIDNKRRLLLDLEVECFSEEHVPAAMAAVAGFVIYGLGIPIAFFLILYFNNHSSNLDDLRFKNKMGFLYAGYERRVYWFESVLLLRRIMFPIVVAFAQTIDGGISLSPGATLEEQEEVLNLVTLTILLLVSLLFFGLHLHFQAYDNRSYFILDRIEAMSLWAIVHTLTAQIFLTVVEISKFTETCVFVLLLGTHFMFWVLVLWGIFRRPLLEFLANYVIPGTDSAWLTARTAWFFGGCVVVLKEGLDVHHITGMEKESFAFLMEEIVEKHLNSFHDFSFRGLVGTLQCMCLEAAHLRRLEMNGFSEEADGQASSAGAAALRAVDDVASHMRKVVQQTLVTPGRELTPDHEETLQEAEYSKEQWDIIVRQRYQFTVEELQMAWLRLASQKWIAEETTGEIGPGPRVSESGCNRELIQIFEHGMPHSETPPPGSEHEESTPSDLSEDDTVGMQSYSNRTRRPRGSPRSRKSTRKKSLGASTGEKGTWRGWSWGNLIHRKSSSAGEERGGAAAAPEGNEDPEAVGPITPMTPVKSVYSNRGNAAALQPVGGYNAAVGPSRSIVRGRSEQLRQGKARQERAKLLSQVSELEERNRKLELALEVLTGAKDTLTIFVQSAQNLPVDNLYYVAAHIRGKEFGAKMQTHAILYNSSLGSDFDAQWNHEDLLHGYADGDSIRFIVWAWGKTKTAQDAKVRERADVKVASADLRAEEVEACLEAAAESSHIMLLQMEVPVLEGSPRPSLQVQIRSRSTQEGGGVAALDDVIQYPGSRSQGHPRSEEAGEVGTTRPPAAASAESADASTTRPPAAASAESADASPLETVTHEPSVQSNEGPSPLPPLETSFIMGQRPEEEPAWTFRVIPENGLKVRGAPDREAAVEGVRKCGEIVHGWKVQNGVNGEWIQLEQDMGYMLLRKGDRDYLVEGGPKASGTEMAMRAAPFYEPRDHTERALRRPDMEEAGDVMDKVNSLPSIRSLE